MSSEPIRVLIVNDMVDVIHLWKRIINMASNLTCVGHAIDGEEAVALAGELRPDVIVMDIMMPKIDGLEATRRILDEQPESIIIIFSARTGMNDAAFDAGAAEFVLLPVYPDQLVSTIQRVYTNKRKSA